MESEMNGECGYNNWPRKLRELASVIGREAALNLSMMYGGRSVYIPKNAIEDHPVAQVIGMEAFKRLVAYCGGLVLRDIPLATALVSKRQAIIAINRNHPDWTGRAIAAELRTTERYVNMVLNSRINQRK